MTEALNEELRNPSRAYVLMNRPDLRALFRYISVSVEFEKKMEGQNNGSHEDYSQVNRLLGRLKRSLPEQGEFNPNKVTISISGVEVRRLEHYLVEPVGGSADDFASYYETKRILDEVAHDYIGNPNKMATGFMEKIRGKMNVFKRKR